MNDIFKTLSQLGEIWYPIKVNSDKDILLKLEPKINGFLTSSLCYTKYLLAIGIDANKIGFINVLQSIEEYMKQYEMGVRHFTVDSYQIAKEMAEFANIKELKISVRINFENVFNNYVCHLGAAQKEAINIIDLLKEKECPNVGLSIYLQDEYKSLENQKKIYKYLEENFPKMDFLVLGGITNQLSEIKKLCDREQFEHYIFELGYYLMKDNNEIKTKIVRTKYIKEKFIIVIQHGIYTGLLDVVLKNKKYRMYLLTDNSKQISIDVKSDSDEDMPVYLFGGSGNYDDFLGIYYIKERDIKNIKPGLNIEIQESGAYVEELMTRYGMYLENKEKKYEI